MAIKTCEALARASTMSSKIPWWNKPAESVSVFCPDVSKFLVDVTNPLYQNELIGWSV